MLVRNTIDFCVLSRDEAKTGEWEAGDERNVFLSHVLRIRVGVR